MRQTGQSQIIPQIPYSNIAQSGGGDVGTVIDVAMAGKGLVTGGARLLAREGAEVVVRSADDVAFAVAGGPAYEARLGSSATSNYRKAFLDANRPLKAMSLSITRCLKSYESLSRPIQKLGNSFARKPPRNPTQPKCDLAQWRNK